jgi:pimeloyl-ACP methyl ester carboxylesterase
MRARLVVLTALWWAAWCPAAGAQTPQRAELTPCSIPGLAGDVRCGSVAVPENRALTGSAGRVIALRVVVARAVDSTARHPDPLVLLAGGPGQAGTSMGPFAAEAFTLVRRTRDLVLFDQRGTGSSGSLACAFTRQPADVGVPGFPAASVRFCRDSLSAMADLTQYTTAANADDLEDLRVALGYPALNIYGTSYGTRLALTYLERHPRGARAAILKAVAPSQMDAPMHYAEDSERAFGLLARDCAADAGCHAAFPDPAGDLRAVLARADSGRVLARIPRRDGGADDVVLSRGAVAGMLLTALQGLPTRAQIPAALHRAAAGDASVLGQAVAQWRRSIDQSLALGMHLSVTCAEDGARLDLAKAAASNATTFLGDSRVVMTAEACRVWRPGPVAAPRPVPVRSDVPVLLVTGELDPNTPPRWGDLAARTLPNSRHVILAGVAHAWNNVANCGSAFAAEFIDAASAAKLDLSCAARPPASSFFVPR